MKFELPEASTIGENSEKNFGHMSCGFEPPTLGSRILHLTNEPKLLLREYHPHKRKRLRPKRIVSSSASLHAQLSGRSPYRLNPQVCSPVQRNSPTSLPGSSVSQHSHFFNGQRLPAYAPSQLGTPPRDEEQERQSEYRKYHFY